MPDLVEQMYCSQQINIPPKYPYILKKFAKAAIKTQPYDLLRWACAYFDALAESRIPPVKARLEYPVFNTTGGLSRGYLRVLVKQLWGVDNVGRSLLEERWRGACLHPEELQRVLCLCGEFQCEGITLQRFVAVCAGLLTKSLTQTMILLCEILTNEPDGGSAMIPKTDFIYMYEYLARLNASTDIRYIDGRREDQISIASEYQTEQSHECSDLNLCECTLDPGDKEDSLIDKVPSGVLVCPHNLLGRPVPIEGGKVTTLVESKTIFEEPKRSASVERVLALAAIENQKERRDKRQFDPDNYKTAEPDVLGEGEDEGLFEGASATTMVLEGEEEYKGPKEDNLTGIEIHVYNENNREIQPHIFEGNLESEFEMQMGDMNIEDGEEYTKPEKPLTRGQIEELKAEIKTQRKERREQIKTLFAEINNIANYVRIISYDLGVISGRQMSTTSGEFVVQAIGKEILEYIDEQIAILPDPELRRKRVDPVVVALVENLLMDYMEEAIMVIVPDIVEEEEEEEREPEIVLVYAIPGIGPVVDESLISEFVQYAQEVGAKQSDMIMPRNLRHFLCPPLEKFIMEDYSAKEEKVGSIV